MELGLAQEADEFGVVPEPGLKDQPRPFRVGEENEPPIIVKAFLQNLDDRDALLFFRDGHINDLAQDECGIVAGHNNCSKARIIKGNGCCRRGGGGNFLRRR